jgi:hypothetical protein
MLCFGRFLLDNPMGLTRTDLTEQAAYSAATIWSSILSNTLGR